MAIRIFELNVSGSYFVTGTDIWNAKSRALDPAYQYDSSQQAYDALGYFEEQEQEFEVFEFETVTKIKHCKPPYTYR